MKGRKPGLKSIVWVAKWNHTPALDSHCTLRDWVAEWSHAPELDLCCVHSGWVGEWNHPPKFDSHCVPRNWVADFSLAAHRTPGPEAGQPWLLQPRPGPILSKPKEGRKVKPSPPLPVASRKISRTCWTGLKSVEGLFSFIPLFFPFFSFTKWGNNVWS